MVANEDNRDEHRLTAERLAKIAKLREQGINPYPLRWNSSHSVERIVAKYGEVAEPPDERVSTAGRIVRWRDLGKMVFAGLSSQGKMLQIQLRADILDESYELLNQLDLGDFLGVKGRLFRTRRGELTVEVTEWRVLGKPVRPLPDKWAGLKEKEQRRRQRYLDLIANQPSFDTAVKRAKVLTHARNFMDERGFLEFETPILNPIAAGAMAAPFATHHNALNRDWYLRIATELPLKKLLVGGFERVYELGRVFRNEGIDRTHNPEFTTMEGYWAYVSYEEIMALIENMCAYVAERINGTTVIRIGDAEADLKSPWKRVSLREELQRRTGIDFVETREQPQLLKALLDKGVRVDPNTSWGKLLDKAVGDLIEPNLTEPTFLVDYPIETTPFAKVIESSPAIVERAEGFVCGMEIVNLFTELNDPIAQKQRLEEQEKISKKYGDSETDRVDDDFVAAMEYGMPPAGGFGIGMDRLAMLISGAESIRDIVLFPALKD